MTTAPKGMEWREEFATGVPEIDEQHLILVSMLNEAAVRVAGDTTAATVERITHDLLGYALYHFEAEEKLMRRYGYREGSPAEVADHLEQHRGFSWKVVAFREELKSGGAVPAEELLDFLTDWLTRHILLTDQKLGAWVLARRAEGG